MNETDLAYLLRDIEDTSQYAGLDPQTKKTYTQMAMQQAMQQGQIEEERKRKAEAVKTLSGMMQNVNSAKDLMPSQDLSPEEQQIKAYYAQAPEEKQAFLRNYEQQVQQKQQAGGTFTNEDLKPYLIAGIQSQQPQRQGGMDINTPQGAMAAIAQGQQLGIPQEATQMIAAGQKEKPAINDYSVFVQGQHEQGITSPAQISENWHKNKVAEALNVGEGIAKARGEALGNMREYSVIDTKNGNTLAYMTPNALNEANKNEPGRFMPASGGTQAMSKNAMINEIEFSSQNVRNALNNIDFSQSQIAKFSNVLKTNDNGGAIGNFLQSNIGKTLTPDEINYVTAIKNLRESAYALRVAGGAGAQSSDMMRGAIDSMVPGKNTPNKEYAMKALDLFDMQAKLLRKGIPKVPGISEGSPVQQQSGGSSEREAIIAELKRRGKL